MVFAAFDELSVARRIARSQTSCIVPLVNAARVAIDPVVVERELFGRMIARWLSRDKRRDRPGRRVHGNDARAVVLSMLIRLLPIATTPSDGDQQIAERLGRSGALVLRKA